MALRDMQELRRHMYNDLNKSAIKGKTLFTGSSLMEGFPINELLMTNGHAEIVYNRGIAGLTTTTFLECIHDVLLDVEPSRVFINIGTNDIGFTENWETTLEENYRSIIRQAVDRNPDVEIVFMAYYPVNEDVIRAHPLPDGRILPRTNVKVARANEIVQTLAAEFNAAYIDVNKGLTDENGQLRADLTVDGIHMYAAGYEIVFRNLLNIFQQF